MKVETVEVSDIGHIFGQLMRSQIEVETSSVPKHENVSGITVPAVPAPEVSAPAAAAHA